MFQTLMQNKLMTVGLAILILGGGWFFLRDSQPSELLVTEDFSSPAAEADKDLVTTLLQLRSVSLDGTIFSDPIFQRLQDFGSQIVPEPVGRPNPFAPLAGRATSTPPTPSPRR